MGAVGGGGASRNEDSIRPAMVFGNGANGGQDASSGVIVTSTTPNSIRPSSTPSRAHDQSSVNLISPGPLPGEVTQTPQKQQEQKDLSWEWPWPTMNRTSRPPEKKRAKAKSKSYEFIPMETPSRVRDIFAEPAEILGVNGPDQSQLELMTQQPALPTLQPIPITPSNSQLNNSQNGDDDFSIFSKTTQEQQQQPPQAQAQAQAQVQPQISLSPSQLQISSPQVTPRIQKQLENSTRSVTTPEPQSTDTSTGTDHFSPNIDTISTPIHNLAAQRKKRALNFDTSEEENTSPKKQRVEETPSPRTPRNPRENVLSSLASIPASGPMHSTPIRHSLQSVVNQLNFSKELENQNFLAAGGVGKPSSDKSTSEDEVFIGPSTASQSQVQARAQEVTIDPNTGKPIEQKTPEIQAANKSVSSNSSKKGAKKKKPKTTTLSRKKLFTFDALNERTTAATPKRKNLGKQTKFLTAKPKPMRDPSASSGRARMMMELARKKVPPKTPFVEAMPRPRIENRDLEIDDPVDRSQYFSRYDKLRLPIVGQKRIDGNRPAKTFETNLSEVPHQLVKNLLKHVNINDKRKRPPGGAKPSSKNSKKLKPSPKEQVDARNPTPSPPGAKTRSRVKKKKLKDLSKEETEILAAASNLFKE